MHLFKNKIYKLTHADNGPSHTASAGSGHAIIMPPKVHFLFINQHFIENFIPKSRFLSRNSLFLFRITKTSKP